MGQLVEPRENSGQGRSTTGDQKHVGLGNDINGFLVHVVHRLSIRGDLCSKDVGSGSEEGVRDPDGRRAVCGDSVVIDRLAVGGHRESTNIFPEDLTITEKG